MKFILNEDTLEVDKIAVGNSGSVNYYEAEVEYDESWNNLNIEAIIVKKRCGGNENTGTSIAVINNKFFIDKKLCGDYYIGFVGYTIENDKKTYQISSNLKYIHFDKGAGEIETENEELPTPTEWEIYIAEIKELTSGITSIPSGGTTGQALVKKSNKDNDFEWRTIQGSETGGAVNSVNGKTGDVNLNAEDVGALPNTTKIPTKTSDLTNDSNFIDKTYHDNTKVDKEVGKGLSTNDYTDEEKEKLSQLENYDDTQVKSDINTINEKIPTQATNNNQLADKDFVNSSLNSITAFYITKNVNGDQFNSKEELDSATEFYSGGEVRVPTRNDYCIVLEDETKDNATTRYIYQNRQWEFQYVVNETPLTSEQVKAINSGITPELVAKLQGIDLTNVVRDANYIHTDNNYTNQEKAKLAGLNNYDDTQIKEDISKKADKVLVVESTTTTLEIQPNKFYKFGEVTELNLTLAEITDATQLNEYMFEFVSGATATTLTLPDTIKWLETPSIESNKTYQCSIVDNIGVLLGVSNV